MSVLGCISDYPILSKRMSDLRACSLDDNGNAEESYLFGYEGFSAVCFDDVMRDYCGEQGVARSVDALYIDDRTVDRGVIIDLIEFKNGNLYERYYAPVSSKDRSEFKKSLLEHIDIVIDKYVMDLGDKLDVLSRKLRDAVDQCVGESFGSHSVRNGGGRQQSNDSFVLESIKTKALSSALLLLSIIEKPGSYIKENVDFILVYNPSSLSDGGRYRGTGSRMVEQVPSVDTTFVSALAKCAGRPVSRFGLKSSLGAFFHDVLTLTSDELYEHLRA